MRCLVTGASGAVGPVLVRRLQADGHDVAVFCRRPGLLRWPARVVAHTGDVLEPDSLRAAMSRIEVVFHLAAMLHVPNPTPDMRAEYQRVNVDGTRTVIESAAAAGARRVVFFSTIAVYGRTGGRLVDETTTPAPDNLYAETKLAAEDIVLRARGDHGGALGAVLRVAAVYGGRVRGNYDRLVRALNRRRFIPIGGGHNRRTLVFDEDLADAALATATGPSAGRIFNVSDGEFHQMSEIIGAISEALGRRPPRFRIPVRPAQSIASVLDGVCRASRLPLAIRPAIDTYVSDIAVDATLIQNHLGWHPRTTLREGWKRAVSEMRDAGML